MPKIQLVEAFQRIPEGTYIFKCERVEFDSTYGVLKLHLVTADGHKHIDQYNLLNANNEVNEIAQMSFSVTARALMMSPDIMDVDTDALVGKYMKATVSHVVKPNRNDPTKTVTFVQLKDKMSANGFESKPFDVNALLGVKG